MPTVTATLSASVNVNHLGSPTIPTGSTVSDQINRTLAVTLAPGTGASQADTVFATSGTFTASTPVLLKLSSAGTLKDAFGAAVSMARIKSIYIANTSAVETGFDITVGAGTNAITTILGGTTPTITIRAGGSILLTAPLAVGYSITTTTDVLQLNPGTGTPSYEVVIIGSSV